MSAAGDLRAAIEAHDAIDHQLTLDRLAEREAAGVELAAKQTALGIAQRIVGEHAATIVQLRVEVARLQAIVDSYEPPVTPLPGLPFHADLDELAKSDKKWLDHYFPVFGMTMENADPKPDAIAKTDPDQFNRSFLPPVGEFASTGGRQRDRPLSLAPYPTSPSYLRNAAGHEITVAKQFLRDGFFVDLMTVDQTHARFYNALRDEANANHPGFLIVPMVDCTTSLARNGGAPLVDTVASFLTTRNVWTLADGSVVVAGYASQNYTEAWWADLAAKLKAKIGKTVSFIHVYNNWTPENVKARKAYASGQWSPGADPKLWKTHADQTAAARVAGQEYLAAWQAQNIRPGTGYGPWFDECLNTEGPIASGERILKDQPKVVQGVTWNDWPEGGCISPSVMRGTVALELSAAVIYEWKTGRKPDYLVDYVVLSHRNQTFDAKITGGQTIKMIQKDRGGKQSPVRNQVEALTQLLQPGKVTITVGGVPTTYDAPAGRSAKLVDLRPGTASVTTDSGLVLVSPIPIRSTSGNQDRGYAMVSNLGPTARQYDPTPAA